MRPLWAEISLSTLRHNFRTVREHVGPNVTICAVVKADAYGHGSVDCARALEAEGANWFGVTSPEEGVRLRDGGITGRVLLLSGFWRGEEDEVVRHHLTPAVWENWHFEALDRAAARQGVSEFPVHLKIDTGMSRLGVQVPCLEGRLQAFRRFHRLSLEGAFSHLASAEVLGAQDVACQGREFEEARDIVKRSGLKPRYFHFANSSATIGRPEAHFDMVRPGLALYGYTLPFMTPSGHKALRTANIDVRPVLSWKTRIIGLRDLPAGRSIGYNSTYTTTVPSRIAAIPAGYADGLSRQLSSRLRVIVRDNYAQVVGRVSMDLTTVDVTNIPGVEVGDEVTLIGASENCCVTAWDVARAAHTVPYEVLCALSPRVARKHVE